MDRRKFVQLLAATPLASIANAETMPKCRVVTAYSPSKVPGMPGPYPGKVVAVRSEKSLDPAGKVADAGVVREMMARGICALTGEATVLGAWRRFFEPADVVGIKVNCGGYPWCISSPEIVAEVVRQLLAVGLRPPQIFLYERFQNQLDEVNYAPHLPRGVQIVAAESRNRHSDNGGYDPATYVEAHLFCAEDTPYQLMRLVALR